MPRYKKYKSSRYNRRIKEFGANIDVYEPWIDEKDKGYYNYNFVETPFDNDKRYESIVVAVGHNKFKTITQKEYDNLIKDEKIIIDVKGIVPNPTWKL